MKNNTVYTESEATLKKKLTKSFLMFSLILPLINSAVLGGLENIIAYFSVANDLSAGIILAQIFSILGEAVSFVCLCLSFFALGALIMSFGAALSIKYLIIQLLSPVISSFFSVIVIYILVLLGWHDMTLRMFFDYLPAIFLPVAALECFITMFTSLAAFAVFYLMGNIEKRFDADKKYKKALMLVFYILAGIKLVSTVTDIIMYDGNLSSVNNVMAVIVFPLLYFVFESVAALFSSRAYLNFLGKAWDESGVTLKNEK